MVLSEEETDGCVQPVVLTYHNVNSLLIKAASGPTRGGGGDTSQWHFEASVDDKRRQRLILACAKGRRCRATLTPCCGTSKMAWQHMALLHQCRINVFTCFCTELHCWASWDLQSVDEPLTFTLNRANVLIYSKEGAFDNGTFFLTFQSVVDIRTRWEIFDQLRRRCVVYNVWHTFAKNWDLFLIFKTRKRET